MFFNKERFSQKRHHFSRVIHNHKVKKLSITYQVKFASLFLKKSSAKSLILYTQQLIN
jgi:hypothetical protein